jgi:carbon-monoxide dehydrogenase medium subunit
MTPASFRYHAPGSVAEAIGLLAGRRARALAGGQSLLPALTARADTPETVVDLNRIRGLPGIELLDGRLRTGALVRQQAALDHGGLRAAQPLLHRALGRIGHRAVRNRGTLVGSLCQLDPWAELPLAAAALEATLLVAGPGGQREVGFGAFAAAPNRPSLAQGEMVLAADWPLWPAGHGAGFVEMSRRPNDPALVAAAALVLLDAGGRVLRAAVALGAVTPLPLRLRAVEAALAGQPAHQAGEAARALLAEDLAGHPVRDDALADAAYRRRVAPVLAARAVAAAVAEAAADG